MRAQTSSLAPFVPELPPKVPKDRLPHPPSRVREATASLTRTPCDTQILVRLSRRGRRAAIGVNDVQNGSKSVGALGLREADGISREFSAIALAFKNEYDRTTNRQASLEALARRGSSAVRRDEHGPAGDGVHARHTL